MLSRTPVGTSAVPAVVNVINSNAFEAHVSTFLVVQHWISFHLPSQVRLGDYMVGLLTSPFKGESLIFHASIAWSRVHEFIGDVSKQAISRMVHKLFHSVERGLGRKEKKKEKKMILLLFFVVILECNDIHKGTHGAVACNVHVSDIRRNVVPRQCPKQITSRSILILAIHFGGKKENIQLTGLRGPPHSL